MKNLISTLIFSFALVFGLKAQTVADMPVFSNKTVVMKIAIANNLTSYVALDDGATSFIIDLVTEAYGSKKEKENNNGRTLAIIMNKLADQGYKFLGSSSAFMSGAITYNYFQKD